MACTKELLQNIAVVFRKPRQPAWLESESCPSWYEAPVQRLAVLRLSGNTDAPCGARARRWVLAATILGSSMAFIDSTVVNVALPALQTSLHATVVGVQWVVESYGLFLGALILVIRALPRRHAWPPKDVLDWCRDFRACFDCLRFCLEH